MKKHSPLIILIFVLIPMSNYACDICGCGNGNFQIGLLPNFRKGFLGFRYSFSHFHSQLKTAPTQFSNDYYQTMELWGGYNLKKLQIMTFMPYVISNKQSDDGITNLKGVGDLMVLINYKILESTSLSNNEKVTVRHELFLGGGIKLPTGFNKIDTSKPNFNIGDFNSQAGTGSIDYLLNTTYNLMWNRSGIVTNVAYRINSTNQQEYRFGNRSYVNASYFYSITKSNTTIKPNTGINYQNNSTNSFSGIKVENSNGYNVNSTVGVNILRNKFGINAMAFIPVAQNNYDGQTKLKSRILFGITYSF